MVDREGRDKAAGRRPPAEGQVGHCAALGRFKMQRRGLQEVLARSTDGALWGANYLPQNCNNWGECTSEHREFRDMFVCFLVIIICLFVNITAILLPWLREFHNQALCIGGCRDRSYNVEMRRGRKMWRRRVTRRRSWRRQTGGRR